jgi:xylulokinase
MPLYLGLDSSTQSLTATAIEVEGATRSVLFSRSFPFDSLLPRYGTRHGVLPSLAPGVVHAPPLMWAEALDDVIGMLTREENVDWSRLRAISGSAQQHGSVYLTRSARDRLAHLDPHRPLAEQMRDVFARPTSPVWMDTSTTAECRQIEQALGGWRAVARLTGSRCYERFTAAQIRRFAREEPGGYARTDRVHLVSSWLASLLAGQDAPIDHGDGSGMNLMAIAELEWSRAAIQSTAEGLGPRLPPLAHPWHVVGVLSPFWIRRFHLPPARVVVWSGDNPCSLVGTGLVAERSITVSLGTSDTIFGPIAGPRPSDDGTGHVFASTTGGYMGMTVFKNGSLARERIRDRYGMDWPAFSRALQSTPPGNRGGIVLPWFEPEITPAVLTPGIRRHGVDPAAAPSNIRGLVEGQMMAMALHSRWMGPPPDTIHATGGASANRDILQIMADVFDATVLQLPSRNSAALGAALRAYHGDLVAEGVPVRWPEVVRGFTEPLPERISPVPAHAEIYQTQMRIYDQLERDALGPGAVGRESPGSGSLENGAQ